MIENSEATLNIKKKSNKRKTKKIALLIMLIGITAVLLVVETYAWFVGTSSITANSFEITVSTGDKDLLISLNGKDFDQEIEITEESITTAAYQGNTNKWVETEQDGINGLIPMSTDGAVDVAAGGRLKLYTKSSLTATQGGFRLLSTRIDNHTVLTPAGDDTAAVVESEKPGYVAFDMFIKNGTGVDYIQEYNEADDEALYLTTTSEVGVGSAGAENFGLENSVRVAFVQVARVAGTTDLTSNGTTVTGMSCFDGGSTDYNAAGVTSLCNKTKTVIWEPNNDLHTEALKTYFGRVCKQKIASEDGESYSYGETPCTLPESGLKTYVVNDVITSNDNIDVYDGINGFTVPAPSMQGDEGAQVLTNNYKLTDFDTFTDTEKNKTAEEGRPVFMYIAPNSITKIRVYVYLEGQDVDNYDVATKGKQISVTFGFTKDQWGMAEEAQQGEDDE